MMSRRVHVKISGKVQGVWFRSYTKKKADELGVTGWVKNTPDGNVEAVFEGEDQQVTEMLEWCHHGPPLAQVEKVNVRQETPLKEFTRFSIDH